jgi:hypothetical protein
MDDIDDRAIKEASRIADERCPLPAHTPASAGALGGMAGFIIVTVFMTLERPIGALASSLLTIGLCALVWFLDARGKWNRHVEIEVEELKRLRERNQSLKR